MINPLNFSGNTVNPYAETGNYNSKIDTDKKNGQVNKVTGSEECQTCKNRKYVDGSDDPGVSFKSPTKVSRGSSGSRVFSHEMEHYTRESAKAERDDREVLSNTIRLKYAICPECGKSYVAGGETSTVTRKKDQNEREQFNQNFFDNTIGKYLPDEYDEKI